MWGLELYVLTKTQYMTGMIHFIDQHDQHVITLQLYRRIIDIPHISLQNIDCYYSVSDC